MCPEARLTEMCFSACQWASKAADLRRAGMESLASAAARRALFLLRKAQRMRESRAAPARCLTTPLRWRRPLEQGVGDGEIVSVHRCRGQVRCRADDPACLY